MLSVRATSRPLSRTVATVSSPSATSSTTSSSSRAFGTVNAARYSQSRSSIHWRSISFVAQNGSGISPCRSRSRCTQPGTTAVRHGEGREVSRKDHAAGARGSTRMAVGDGPQRLLLQWVVQHELNDFTGVAEAHRRDRVRGPVVNRDPARGRVAQAAHRETHAGDKPREFVRGLGTQELLIAAGDHLRRLLEVKQRGAHRVDIAVTGGRHAMIEEQPAGARLDWGRPGADLGALPPRPAAAHDVAVPAPVDPVGALADKNVAERRVARVARAAEHEELSVDLPREQHAGAG